MQRHVEVLGDAIGGSKEIDEVLGNIEGLDGTDAEPFDRRFVEDAAKEIFEFHAGRKLAAVVAEVDSAENDFAVPRFAETPDLLNHGAGWETAALAADERNDAVRATGVTAILDFESWTGVIPFPAEDGCEEKFGAVKDVAGENLGKLRSIPTGPGQVLRPYKGMERNG